VEGAGIAPLIRKGKKHIIGPSIEEEENSKPIEYTNGVQHLSGVFSDQGKFPSLRAQSMAWGKE